MLKAAGAADNEKSGVPAACVVAVACVDAADVPAASTASTTKKYAVEAARAVFAKDAAVNPVAT